MTTRPRGRLFAILGLSIAVVAIAGSVVAPDPARAVEDFVGAKNVSIKAGLVDPSRAHVFNQFCGSHMVLAQANEIMDSGAVTEIVMRCQPVDMYGKWSGDTPNDSQGWIVAMREKAYAFNPAVFDGKKGEADCPPDSWVVGFNPGTATVNKGGPKRDVVWIHRLICASSQTPPTEVGFDWAVDADKQRYVGFDGVGGARSCGPYEVGIGIWSAVSEDYIEAFGLICQRRIDAMGAPPPNPAILERVSPGLLSPRESRSPQTAVRFRPAAPKLCFAAGPNGCIQH